MTWSWGGKGKVLVSQCGSPVVLFIFVVYSLPKNPNETFLSNDATLYATLWQTVNTNRK